MSPTLASIARQRRNAPERDAQAIRGAYPPSNDVRLTRLLAAARQLAVNQISGSLLSTSQVKIVCISCLASTIAFGTLEHRDDCLAVQVIGMVDELAGLGPQAPAPLRLVPRTAEAG